MIFNIKKLRTSLKTRLLFWVWLVTSVATFIFTLLQLASDFQQEKSMALRQIDVIQKDHLPALTESLWDYNRAYSTIQCESFRDMQYIGYVKLNSEDEVFCDLLSPGITSKMSLETKVIPILHGSEKIGELTIGLDLSGLKHAYILKAIKILLIQGLKTFIVCLLLLKIFENVIMKHLAMIVSYLKNFKLDDTPDLELSRDKNLDDDLTIVENSINTLKSDLRMAHKKLLDINNELELQVAERTAQRDEQRARAVEATRLVSLGQMSSGIAHEINTPLTIISMANNFIKKKASSESFSNEDIHTSTKQIDDTVVRITKIISGLKTLSHDSKGPTKTHVRVSEILDDVMSVCMEKFKNNGITFKNNLDQTQLDSVLYCDKVGLCQTLLNLLVNAFDATKGTPSPWIEISYSSDKGNQYLRVTDSGIPITDETKNKLFEPFFTTKDVGHGTGLGLSISRSLMEKHGGNLYLDEEMSHTSFVIKLPKEEQMAC